MSSFLQLALVLSILITAAKTGGWISFRLGQPSVLGELLVGIILGPTFVNILGLPFLTNPYLPDTIHDLAELGVMLLMFLAGLELHLTDMIKSGKAAALAGTLGVVAPLILGAAMHFYFPIPLEEAVFLGLILSATSVSISAQTLMELQALRSRVGITLLGAAVFDDILVVLGLSVFSAIALSDGSTFLGVASVILMMLLYLGIGSAVGFLLIPKAIQKIVTEPISQGLISLTLICILIYGWSAEVLGNMAAITGSFLVGLIFAQSPQKKRIEEGISSIAYGFLVPIFFINIGLQANLGELIGPGFWMFLVMSILAIVSKIIGSGTGAVIGGFTRREALRLGIGMISRGEVGLIVASVGIAHGIISQMIFSAVIGVVIVTTILTPPLLRLTLKKTSKRSEESRIGY